MRQSKLKRIYTRHLRNSKPTLENIFEINFSHHDFPIFEYDEEGKTIKIGYQEAKHRIKEVAGAIEELNIKDQYIGLNMDNSPNWVIGFWSILMSGNKPYLINRRHPSSLTKSILDTLEVKYCLDDEETNVFGRKSLQISALKKEIDENHKFNFANELAISTSGTTMEEKICIYTGAEILSQLSNTEYVLSKSRVVRKMYKKTIKLLAFLPFYHIFGLITVYFWFTYFGYTIVFLKDYSPNTILHTIRKHEVTHIFAVPLFWHSVEDAIRKEVTQRDEKTQARFAKWTARVNNLQNINLRFANFLAKKAFKEVRNSLFGDSANLCITGGSYIRSSTLDLMSGLGYPLFNGYGTSEIGITSVELSNKYSHRKLGSVGMPFPSVNYEIKNGTLCVKGKSTCQAVIVNGKRIVTNEWFDTLDIAHVDKNGRYFIDGRKTDLIISENGENVNPDFIEGNFNFANFSVKYFCVLGLKEGERENISLVVEPSKKLIKEEINVIKNYIYSVNDKLPSTHKINRIYLTYDDIQNENAIKVSRTYLKKGIDAGKIHLKDINDESILKDNDEETSLTLVLIDIFSNALRLDKEMIKPTSHFLYDLHGTSLDYFALLSMINERFNTSISFDPDHPLVCVKDFEDYLKENKQ